MDTTRRIARLLTLAALLAVAAALTPIATVLAENTVSVGVTGGQRTAYASAVRFDRTITSGGTIYQLGTATIEIDDSTGTNAGWQVAIASSDTSVLLLQTSDPITVSGQTIDEHHGPDVTDSAIGQLDVPRTVISAEAGYGKGAYRLVVTVARARPADPAAQSQPLELAVTITPNN